MTILNSLSLHKLINKEEDETILKSLCHVSSSPKIYSTFFSISKED